MRLERGTLDFVYNSFLAAFKQKDFGWALNIRKEICDFKFQNPPKNIDNYHVNIKIFLINYIDFVLKKRYDIGKSKINRRKKE